MPRTRAAKARALLLPRAWRLYAPKPITTPTKCVTRGMYVLYVSDGGIGTRYELWSGFGGQRRLLLDLFVLYTGKADDLTRPPFEWG